MLIFLKGVLIGIANIIPGLSGGTMAVILGLYSRVIEAISELTTFKLNAIKKHFLFLFLMFFGAIVGIFAFANIIDYFLSNYAESTFFFFIGTVIASIPIVIGCHDDMAPSFKRCICLFLFFLLPVLFLFVQSSNGDQLLSLDSFQSQLLLLFSGFVAAVAMILPGISGSFILLVLGSYETIVFAIKSLNFYIIGIVGIGIILGILLCAKFVRYCLHRFPSLTYYGILGLVLGSVPALWPGISLGLIFIDSICFLVGIAIVFLFKKKYSDI